MYQSKDVLMFEQRRSPTFQHIASCLRLSTTWQVGHQEAGMQHQLRAVRS